MNFPHTVLLKILEELKKISCKYKLTKKMQEDLAGAVTYCENHIPHMNDWEYIENEWPIGSGVTEAACKMLVKQRLCCSGMRWKKQGAKLVLILRSLVKTTGRWKGFWRKIDQYGVVIDL